MANCIHCEANLSWFFIFKRLMIVKSPDVQCPSCCHKLYFTSRSKKILVGTTMLIPVLFVLAFMLGHMALFLVWIIGFMLVLPWLVTVSEKEEPIF
ncbi:hypothetical protein ABEW00_16020 [Rossellomorea vietnamensis]|uniref:TIGR04104 family putative zinc finger protein n=1 Tax=Rossellomorea vietnamensis TaxID=218284 RepID=UPI003D2C35B4